VRFAYTAPTLTSKPDNALVVIYDFLPIAEHPNCIGSDSAPFFYHPELVTGLGNIEVLMSWWTNIIVALENQLGGQFEFVSIFVELTIDESPRR